MTDVKLRCIASGVYEWLAPDGKTWRILRHGNLTGTTWTARSGSDLVGPVNTLATLRASLSWRYRESLRGA